MKLFLGLLISFLFVCLAPALELPEVVDECFELNHKYSVGVVRPVIPQKAIPGLKLVPGSWVFHYFYLAVPTLKNPVLFSQKSFHPKISNFVSSGAERSQQITSS